MKYIPNPCFNGILKYLLKGDFRALETMRLNPCFNGILKYSSDLTLTETEVS